MAKTTCVLIGVGLFAVLLGTQGAAQSQATPTKRATAPATAPTVSRRLPPTVARDQPAAAHAVPRQPQAEEGGFVPTLGYAGGGQNGVHPAVGSWFGKAIQICGQGVAPSACANGQPATALFMTPTLTPDGLFIGNDSFANLPAPFGPHTTAHGSWTATSATEFTAEYVFMTVTYPPVAANTISGYRFRWAAQVISADTAVGYVNLYPLPSVPVKWTPLLDDEFPVFPPEAAGYVTPPIGMVKDPTLCRTDGCPLVFKFTIKRVTQ